MRKIFFEAATVATVSTVNVGLFKLAVMAASNENFNPVDRVLVPSALVAAGIGLTALTFKVASVLDTPVVNDGSSSEAIAPTNIVVE